MDKKTRDYFDTRVSKYDELNTEKLSLEGLVFNLTKETDKESVASVCTNARTIKFDLGSRKVISEYMINGCRKRIGEIERLMEEI